MDAGLAFLAVVTIRVWVGRGEESVFWDVRFLSNTDVGTLPTYPSKSVWSDISIECGRQVKPPVQTGRKRIRAVCPFSPPCFSFPDRKR